jgi:hypothetical protein
MSHLLEVAAPRRCCILTATLLLGSVVLPLNCAGAAEILLKHDSIPAGGSHNPLNAFLVGEQAASWFTSPVNGDLVGVQIQWDSQFGGNPNSQEFAVYIYAGGIFPTPGPLLAQIVAPVLTDGSANEMRYLDPPADTSPLQVPVTPGQSFVVALEFFNQNSGNLFASSVEIDQDGILPGVNSVFALPGGWLDAGPQGVTGDFGIRAIVNQIPEPSALLLALAFTSLWTTSRRCSALR